MAGSPSPDSSLRVLTMQGTSRTSVVQVQVLISSTDDDDDDDDDDDCT